MMVTTDAVNQRATRRVETANHRQDDDDRAVDRIARRDGVRVAASLFIIGEADDLRHRTLPFKKGAFYLAFEAGLPILPLTLSGTRDALPAKGIRSRRGAKVRATLHPHVDPRPYAARGRTGRQALMDEVRQTLESAL